ncbi:MAG: ATP phosphoribosyltransferase [Sediminispirochaetaceae bacterium]
MTDKFDNGPLTLALPKGRLFDQVQELFAQRGLSFTFEKRKLVAHENTGLIDIFLIKNSDLPTYVNHGIAGLGVSGEDVIYESGLRFFRLYRFEFGGTRMCLAAKQGHNTDDIGRTPTIATKFPRYTRDFFHNRNVPVQIVKLNGSVELAPILGLSPYIVDLVETGSTLKANKLEVIETLGEIGVYLIANPSYYKLRYESIHTLLGKLRGDKAANRKEHGNER